jgi:hypothetical protein
MVDKIEQRIELDASDAEGKLQHYGETGEQAFGRIKAAGGAGGKVFEKIGEPIKIAGECEYIGAAARRR